jgi:hypothetical protein
MERIETKFFAQNYFELLQKLFESNQKNQISHEMRKHNQFVAQLCKMESGKWEYEGLGFMYVCAQFHP